LLSDKCKFTKDSARDFAYYFSSNFEEIENYCKSKLPVKSKFLNYLDQQICINIFIFIIRYLLLTVYIYIYIYMFTNKICFHYYF